MGDGFVRLLAFWILRGQRAADKADAILDMVLAWREKNGKN